MNINKHKDFFDPSMLEEDIHIIGCGAVGSTIAEMFARIGCSDIHLWDMDVVTAHNIANQMFRDKDIDQPKVTALEDIMKEINPAIKLTLHEQGYQKVYDKHPLLTGYVFLCVDNIDLRREIVEAHLGNPNIKAMFDCRMRLTDAQHYAANWADAKQKENLLATMQFSHEEAKEATPISACGTTLSIVPTVRTLCSVCVANMINFFRTGSINTMVLVDPFYGVLDSFAPKA